MWMRHDHIESILKREGENIVSFKTEIITFKIQQITYLWPDLVAVFHSAVSQTKCCQVYQVSRNISIYHRA